MEKVACMQSLLADNLRENCGHFWINNDFLVVFTHQYPHVCIFIHNVPIFVRKYQIFSDKIGYIVDKNADMWVLMGKHYKKIIVYPKMPTIFSNIVRKQLLRACSDKSQWVNLSL